MYKFAATVILLGASRLAAPQAPAPGVAPGVIPRDAQAEGGPLAAMVRLAFATGFGGPLSGRLCTALGITKNGQPLPVEQLSALAGDVRRTFNVSRHRGTLDIIMSRRIKSETTLFLASAEGNLAKAMSEKQGSPVQDIPLDAARPDFEKEKAWWLDNWLKSGKK